MKRLSNSGNILVIVLVFIIIAGISFHAMIDYALSQKRQTVKNNHILEMKFALDSAVDFVLFGIKQKYCFTDILMSDSNCDLKHTGSTERLIMSMEQVSFLITAGKVSEAAAADLRLSKITRDLEIANITSAHPLFGVLQALQMQPELADIKYLHVEIERNDSVFLPRSGNEVYLKILVSLQKTQGVESTVTVANQKLKVVSNLVIYPREVGSFALLVPRDMYLGSNSPAPTFGDSHFLKDASKGSFAGSTGLLFLSPVFVNRNIVLSSDGYSPVTFADRVYMGEGRVLNGLSPYAPATNGGTKGRYWRDVPVFGGFLRGLENDGALDAGLNAFIGANSVGTPPVSEELMKKCVERNLSRSDLRRILTSQLSVQLQSGGPGFRYLFTLTNSEFEGQNSNPMKNISNWGTGTLSLNYDDNFRKTIMDTTLKVGSRDVGFSMSKDSVATAIAQVGSPQYEAKLRADLRTAQTALDQALQDPDGSYDIQNLRAAVLAAQNKLDDYLYKVAHPPKITIETDPIQRKHGTSDSKLNFVVDIENPGSLLDANGQLVNPVISVKSYDSGYMEGGFIGNRHDAWRNENNNNNRFPENPNIARTLNFTVNVNNSIVEAPAGIPVAMPIDYEDLGDLCMEARDAMESQAFGMADANVSFADSTRLSWNFAGTGSETGATKTDPLINSITFDHTNGVAGAGVTSFQVRSIVGTCTIKASANFVTGFFACNKLVIEARKNPLRIIGTFIAGNVMIDPTAYKAGIVWSSIYHPQSVEDLRKENILKKTSTNGVCAHSPNSPIWNPVPSIQEVVDRMTCNVISLRAKADPFQWTTVDPDCGMLPGKSNMTCKKRLVRFFVVEQSREEVR